LYKQSIEGKIAIAYISDLRWAFHWWEGPIHHTWDIFQNYYLILFYTNHKGWERNEWVYNKRVS